MKKNAAAKRRVLTEAVRTADPVKFDLTPDSSLEMYVLAVAGGWCVGAPIDGNTLIVDGLAALRIRDIAGFKKFAGSEFLRRYLELDGKWPLQPLVTTGVRELGVNDAREALELLSGVHPMLQVHLAGRPHVSYYGVVAGFTDTEVDMLLVDPEAEWDDEVESFDLKDVSLVQGGTLYARALYLVAGPPETNGLRTSP